jgi:DNA polymerase sigma
MEVVDNLNIRKSCGSDMMYPKILKNQDIKRRIIQSTLELINGTNQVIPEYYKETRLVLLSKDLKDYATVSNTRPISVQQVVVRVLEKALLKAILKTDLMSTGSYQTGFKSDNSTQMHVSRVLKSIKEHQQKDRKNRKIYMFVDLKKAYDSVRRSQLFDIIWKRAGECP